MIFITHFRTFFFAFNLIFLISLSSPQIANCELEDAIKDMKKGNYLSAYKEFSILGEKGNATAQFYLGQMYRIGLYVKENHQKSFAWYKKSAKQGVSFAQFYLGNMYLRGSGISVDIQKATKWYIKAANQGHIIAQYHLGRMYQRGDGVSSNNKKSAKWFRKAAKQGYILAQYKLGLMYLAGDGVPKNYIQAHKWLNLSGIIGRNKIATALLDSIEKDMTTSQIQKANSLANKWLKQKRKK